MAFTSPLWLLCIAESMSGGRTTPKVLARRQQSPGRSTSPIHRPNPQRTLRNDPAYTPYSPVNSAEAFDPRVPLDTAFSKGRATPEPQRSDSPSAYNFRSNSNAAQQHASQLSALQQHIVNLEDRLHTAEFEKEQLLTEKAHWITTLQDENNILVSVLQDARKYACSTPPPLVLRICFSSLATHMALACVVLRLTHLA